MNRSSQRGSAIIMLFIAVALFGALAYAFMQGSRTSTSMMTGEAAKAKTYKSKDCTNSVDMATKRLVSRGCGSMISAAADGSNISPGAPVDGSCSIYHPNGGGVKASCIAPPDVCTTATEGTICDSGDAFYAGSMSGVRLYVATADLPATKVGGTAGINNATSPSDGPDNTDKFYAQDSSVTQAAGACRALGPQWYVPTEWEFVTIWNNRVAIDLTAKGFDTSGAWYWSSKEVTSTSSGTFRFNDGATSAANRINSYRVRCFHR